MPSQFSWLQEHGVALYAAVLSTVVFVRQVFDARWARTVHLRVEVGIAQMYVPSHGGEYQRSYTAVDFKALNVGAREVRVKQCGLAHAQRRRLRNVIGRRLAGPIPSGPLKFPHDIPPGHSASFQFDVTVWCENPPPEGWRHFQYVYFEDDLGTYHKARASQRFWDDLEEQCRRVSARPHRASEES